MSKQASKVDVVGVGDELSSRSTANATKSVCWYEDIPKLVDMMATCYVSINKSVKLAFIPLPHVKVNLNTRMKYVETKAVFKGL